MPYLTPPTAPSQTVRRCLFIPDHPLWLAAVSGALLELTRAYNWEDLDGITTQEAASRSLQMFQEYISGECGMIGEIKAFASVGAVPSNCLLMDGRQWTQAQYPKLFDVVPAAWKSGVTFVLPSMIKRTVIGNDTDNPGTPPIQGTTGGEENHTLTQAEIPAHTHGFPNSGSALAFTGQNPSRQDNPAGTFWSTIAATASTGGGNPHNNMPPYLVVVWAIVAT